MRVLLFACALVGSAGFAQDAPKGIVQQSAGPRSPDASGGPDAFGYTFIDSNEAGGPVFAWVDITVSGTALGLGDDAEANVGLGFEFPYYGAGHRALRVGNNGGLLLGATAGPITASHSCPLPVSGGSPRISVFWDDIDSDSGDVYHQEFASCPHAAGGTGPCWVVEWHDRPHFPDTGSASFEAILWENGSILFQYLDTDFGDPAFDAGASAAIGIEDDGASPGYFLQYSCDNTGAVPSGHALLWLPGARSCVQNFDSVTAPAFPAGWTASALAGDGPGFQVQNLGILADTPPNVATVADSGGGTDDHVLVSETFPIAAAGARLHFRLAYNLLSVPLVGVHRGGVLEISIGGGAFQDLLAAGGSFVQNGYTGTVGGGPLAGRQAWTGIASPVTVVANLPAAAAGESVQFRWRRGKVGAAGVHFMTIDSVGVQGCSRCALTCPASPLVAGTDPGVCSAAVDFAPVTAGACAPVACVPPSGSSFAVGSTPVACTELGGVACTFAVEVVDDDNPVVVAPDTTVGTDPGVCSAVATFAAAATDNCGVASLACVPPSGSTFPLGVTVGLCTASDAAGNVGTDPFTVTVLDDEPPTIVPLPDLALPNDPGFCSAVATFAPVFGDNCPGATAACAPPSASAFPVGTTPVTCTVTDAGGTQTSDVFQVSVSDVESPVVVAPDTTVVNDPGLCEAVVVFAPTATDNCAGLSPIQCVPPSGSVFPVGVTPGVCSATDASGNVGSDPFTVTVIDAEAPTFDQCPDDIVVEAPPGAMSQVVTFEEPVASDNCPGATSSCVPPSGDAFPIGTTSDVCTAVDTAGNQVTCEFDVTVVALAIQEIPALSRGGLLLLSVLVGAAALAVLRRR